MYAYRITGPKYMSSYSKDSLVILEYLDQRTAKFMSPEIASDVLKDLSNHSLENSSLKMVSSVPPNSRHLNPLQLRAKVWVKKAFHNILCKWPWEKLFACETDQSDRIHHHWVVLFIQYVTKYHTPYEKTINEHLWM